MSAKVKICGLRTFEAARVSFKEGADFLGFNFVPTSKRFISQEKAKEIISQLPKEVKVVGVFQNESIENIKKTIDILKLDFIQLHGEEPSSYRQLTQYAGVIKVFSLESDFDLPKTISEMEKYDVDYFLVDRKYQGRGEPLDPERVRGLTSLFPIILAGGLTVENVKETVRVARPFAVDVAGGVESEGEEDLEKIKEFIKRTKSV